MITYNQHLDNIERKSPLHGKGLRLDKSERLIPIPQEHWNKFKKTLNEEDFSIYPDPTNLIKKIAKHNSVSPEQVCINFGSDSSIRTVFEAFVKPGGNIITSNPCFPMYEVYAKEFQGELRKIDYRSDTIGNFEFHIKDILDKVDENTNLVVLANPNSPIGNYHESFWIYKLLTLLSKKNIPLLLDEAYVEFYIDYGNASLTELTDSCYNLIITKTFSKALGAAGIRLGYTISNQNIINILNKLKPTFEITGPSLKYAEYILDNYDNIVVPYVARVREEKFKIRYMLMEAGYEVLDSKTNWIHINKGEDNGDLTKTLDIFNINYKGGLTLPFRKGNNWVRLSILPGFHKHDCFKAILKNR